MNKREGSTGSREEWGGSLRCGESPPAVLRQVEGSNRWLQAASGKPRRRRRKGRNECACAQRRAFFPFCACAAQEGGTRIGFAHAQKEGRGRRTGGSAHARKRGWERCASAHAREGGGGASAAPLCVAAAILGEGGLFFPGGRPGFGGKIRIKLKKSRAGRWRGEENGWLWGSLAGEKCEIRGDLAQSERACAAEGNARRLRHRRLLPPPLSLRPP